MSRIERLDHNFVEAVPNRLDEGMLYIALEHATMVHLCACGCGSEVVLPLSPTDWKMTFDGKTVSVSPSVGSWSLACRSHYVVDHGRVRWAGSWTDKEIAAGRQRDRQRKVAPTLPSDEIRMPDERIAIIPPTSQAAEAIIMPNKRAGWSARLKRRLRL